MIRVNLLPSGKKKRVIIPTSLVYGVLSTVVLIVIIAGMIAYMNRQVSSIKKDITRKEQKLNQMRVVLQKVKNYERDNQEFRDKAKIIEQLKRNQVVPLRLLDEVSELMPKGVWLTKLADKGGLISIEGYAFTNSDLVGYVQNLKGSRHLSDVMLVESRQAELGGYTIYKYKMTFNIKA
jgi:Tfp pilus assembly protein PilN